MGRYKRFLALLVIMAATSSGSCSNQTILTPPGSSTQVATENGTVSLPPGDNYNNGGMYLSWWLSDLIIKPDTISAGEKVEIQADLYISDMIAGHVNAYLFVNGETISHQRFAIIPDEFTTFFFTCTFDEPGIYNISIRTYMEAEKNAVFGLSNPEGFLASYSEINVQPPG